MKKLFFFLISTCLIGQFTFGQKKVTDNGFYINFGAFVPFNQYFYHANAENDPSIKVKPGFGFELGNIFNLYQIDKKQSLQLKISWLDFNMSHYKSTDRYTPDDRYYDYEYRLFANDDYFEGIYDEFYDDYSDYYDDYDYEDYEDYEEGIPEDYEGEILEDSYTNLILSGSILKVGPRYCFAINKDFGVDASYQIAPIIMYDFMECTAGVGMNHTFGLGLTYKKFTAGLSFYLGKVKDMDYMLDSEYYGSAMDKDMFKYKTSSMRASFGFKF